MSTARPPSLADPEPDLDPAVEDDPPGSVSRLRLAAACALLIGLAFVQDPGFLVPDTKFDLVEAPGAFLARALHLWDAEGAFGQVQNQAYGYLWPMGPFFWIGDLLGLPGWTVQRAWQALVLCVAFVGAARLARALGVRTDAACLVAAAAYALSPRMLTTIGPISIEAWPSSLAPWVLLPLVLGARGGSPRRAAALSALAVAMVGGVNAAATLAVLPLGALWLLTRERGRRRRSLMLWWPVLTLLGTLWWLVPLALLGTYSPPFLDYIETGTVTSFPTTLVDTLRGTSNWVPYIDASSRAGNDLVTDGYLAVNSGVVLLVGFLGLLDRTNPHRRFLGLGLGVGVVMVGAAHVGSVDGWAAADLRALLDGALAPLRNVHKFDPLVRLPLVLGLGWALDRVLSTGRRVPRPRLERVAFTAMTVAAVIGAAVPALTTRLEPAGALIAVPDYWVETADWLAAESDGGVALLAPGSTFGTYTWGSPRDEPMQWLADSRWAVRNVIPLAPAGNIRMLDEVERRLAQGQGSPALPDYLRRAGVEHLVVRNDLRPSSDIPDPALVHQAIAGSPGLELVAEFGPLVGGEAHLRTSDVRLVVNSGRQSTYAAVEVFEVGGATAVSAGAATVVAGGPEDLLDLLDLGVVDEEPTVLARDVPGADLGSVPVGQVVLTDGLRDRERLFSRVHDGYGPTRDPGYVRRTTNPAPDYTLGTAEADDLPWRTTVTLEGATSLSASSSASDPDTLGGARPGEMPAAALDGDRRTAWVSGPGVTGQAWWRLDTDGVLDPTDTLALVGGGSAADNQSVRVLTAGGRSDRLPLGPGVRREVALPEGATSWVRVESASLAGAGLALAEVELPGDPVVRRLVLPRLPARWGAPDTVVLRTADDDRSGCVAVGFEVRCAAERAVPGEESANLRRVVPLTGAATFDEVRLRVAPRAGPALDRRALRGQAVSITASSRPVMDPRGGALAAIDGDPGTTWTAAAATLEPQLVLRWFDRRTVGGLTLRTDPDTAAAAPTRVEVRWPTGRVERAVEDGRVDLPAVQTRRLRIRVLEAEAVQDLDFAAQARAVPVGITELTVEGLPYVPLGLSADEAELPCGSGPTVRVGDRTFRTAVVAAPAQLARGDTVPARLCTSSPVALEAGDTVVDVIGNAAFDASSLVLTDTPGTSGEEQTGADDVPLRVLGPTQRQLSIDGAAGVVVLRENANPGWVAQADGVDLEPVVVDGWQQGFLPPAGADVGRVDVSYAPDVTYRIGLVVGAIAVVLLGAALLLTRRRWAGPVPPPVGTARIPAPLVWTVAGVLAGLVAGWPGVLVAAVAGVVAWALDRWVREGAALLLALPCLLATVPYLVTPWGSADGWAGNAAWPHYLVLVPLVSVLVLAAPTDRPAAALRRLGARRSRSRIAGRSTTR